MALTRKQLSDICHASCDDVHEGVTTTNLSGVTQRIVYWDYIWDDVVGSGETYDVHVTYQISVFATKPHCKALLKLRDNLRTAGVHPTIYHEYNEDDHIWHSYMSIDTIGDVSETGK